MVRQRIVTDYARWKSDFLISRFRYVSHVRAETVLSRAYKDNGLREIEIEEYGDELNVLLILQQLQ